MLPFLHFGLEKSSATILYVAAIVVFLLSIGWRPIIGLLFMLPTIPIHTVRARLYALPLGGYFIDFLLLGIFMGLLMRGQLQFPKGVGAKLLIAYIFFTYISLVHGAFTLGSPLPVTFADPRLSYWHSIVRMPLLAVAAYGCVRNRRQLVLVMAFTCIGILGLSRSFDKNIVQGRDFSTFNYNVRQGGGAQGYAGINGLASHQAQWAAFFICLTLASKGPLNRLASLGVGGVCIYCVLFALSRGAYAAVLVTWVYLAIWRRKFALLVPLVAFALTWQAFVPGAVRERVLGTVNEQSGEIESSAAKRLDLWESTLELIKSSSLVMGTGFYTYRYLGVGGEFKDTHNLYLKILAETGIIGLVLFLAIWFCFYRQSGQIYKRARDPLIKAVGLAFGASMVSLVIANFFGDRWFYIQISGYTFVMFGVINRLYVDLDEKESLFALQRAPVAARRALAPYTAVPQVAPAPLRSYARTSRT